MNTPNYVNTPQDAIDRLRAEAPEIEGLQMNPGDVWTSDGTLTRLRPAPDWSRRMEHIEELSRQHRAQIAEDFASEASRRPTCTSASTTTSPACCRPTRRLPSGSTSSPGGSSTGRTAATG